MLLQNWQPIACHGYRAPVTRQRLSRSNSQGEQLLALVVQPPNNIQELASRAGSMMETRITALELLRTSCIVEELSYPRDPRSIFSLLR